MTIESSLIAATVTTAGLAVAGLIGLRGTRLHFDRRGLLLAGAILALGLVLSACGLWTSWFSGLPSVGGNDAGIHLGMRRIFLGPNPRIYHGFVTFYSVTYWLERIFGLDAFGSFRFMFYLVVGTVWLTLAAAAVIATADESSNWGGRSVLRLLALPAAGSLAILLPLLHYYQADGFFAILFGLAPLLLGWVAYGIAERTATRLAILAMVLVAERFTYGINVGDLLLATAALMVWEGWEWPARRRWLTLPYVLAAVAATFVFWRQVASFVLPVGGAYSIRLAPLLVGEVLVTASLAILPSFVPLGRRSSFGRLAQFAAVVGACNVGGQVLWLRSALPVGYYFYRYHMQVVILVTGAAVVLGPIALAGVRARHGRAVARSLGSLLLAGLVILGCGFPRHQDSFLERMFKGPPWRHLKPLADVDGIVRIRRLLAEEQKRCTVVLATSWSTVFFMNASLDCPKGPAWDASMDTTSWNAPGGCVFWYGGPADIAEMGRYATPTDPPGISSEEAARRVAHRALGHRAQQLAAELNASPGAVCEEYPARWDPRRQLRLCHSCF